MVSQKEYKLRRKQLALKLPPDSVAIISSAHEIIRNGDAHYRFRQDSDFFYLTGFVEPDALLVITTGADSREYLFNLPKDPSQEQWTGIRLGQDNACAVLGVDEAYPIFKVGDKLAELLQDKQTVFYFKGRYPAWDNKIQQAWQVVKGLSRKGINAPETFCDISGLIAEMRLFKSDAEITLLREAAEISAKAHYHTIQHCKKAQFEYQLEAQIRYGFMQHGCRDVAYDPIVAGGANACILHYTENSKPLCPGDLVLIDAGGEYENYAADITRTFPLNGQFSPEQRQIYELVLAAQKAGLAKIRPGCGWYEIQEAILQTLTQGLVDLGILKGDPQNLLAVGAYKPFYMHNSGHWLGLDVHDCGKYKINNEWRVLEPGMVLTVEPGLYLSAGIPNLSPRWQGIGVRIEDDILVTAQGYENLTQSLPSEIADIEALIRGS